MRNTISLLTCFVLLIAVMGCGIVERAKKEMGTANAANTNVNSNKTLTDKAIDTAVGEEKVGIPECDEVIDILAVQANNPDDNFVTKALKATALTRFREQVRKSLENNKSNRTDIAKFCRDFKSNLDKSASEQPANRK